MNKRTKTNSIIDAIFVRTVYLMTLIQLSRVGASFVDSFIMSRAYGRIATDAAGLAWPFFTVTSLIAGLISTGCQSICGQSLGAGDKEKAKTAFSTSIVFGVCVSVIVGGLIYYFASPICQFLGAKGDAADILTDASSYVQMLALGTTGLILNFILAPIVQLDGGKKLINITTLVIFGFDVIFDVLAVILDWGVVGIGLATTISTYMGTILYIIFFMGKKMVFGFSVRNVDFKVGIAMIKQGGPDAFKRLYRVIRDFINNYYVLFLGAGIALAGKTVGDALINLLTCLGVGVSYAVYLLSGVYIGEKNRHGMEMLVKRAMINVGVTALIAIVSMIFAPQLLQIFLPSLGPEQKIEAAYCVRGMLSQMPFYVSFEAYTSYLQSIGKRRDSNVVSFCGIIVFYFPAAMILDNFLGAAGTLYSIPLGFFLALLTYYIYRWIRIKRRPTMDDFFYLTEQFGEKDLLEYNKAVRTKQDVSECCEGITELLLKEGVSRRSANHVSLIIEEICINTITYGFPKVEASRQLIEVRVLLGKDEIVVRLQDDCEEFDVSEKYYEIKDKIEDPESGMGLKLVHVFSEDVRYLNTLNLNNLIVTASRT